MSFGFPAYHQEIYRTNQDNDFKRKVTSVVKKLSFKIKYETENKIVVNTGLNFWSWGEILYFDFSHQGHVKIKSICRFPLQCFDWGKNRENVLIVISELDNLKHENAQISADSFKKDIKKAHLLLENEILSVTEFEQRKRTLITDLSTEKINEDPHQFLSKLIPLKEKDILSEENLTQIKNRL